VKLTVTFVLFQLFALGAGVREPAIVGGVLSIFTAGEVNIAVFPALSVTVIVPVTTDPSALSASGLTGVMESRPERESTGVNGMDTLLLFQPAPLGAGLACENVTVGAVLSKRIISVWAASIFPELSVAK
jgi:hypothetical protein